MQQRELSDLKYMKVVFLLLNMITSKSTSRTKASSLGKKNAFFSPSNLPQSGIQVIILWPRGPQQPGLDQQDGGDCPHVFCTGDVTP